MKIVIAPDSYKESLSAAEVAQAIEKGFREIFPDAQYVSVPVADGGEGTVEAMIAATQGTEQHAVVTGPLGEKVKACWGISGDGATAIIEMAAASGLALVPAAKRNPLITTSRGTGELILDALDKGARNIIIGIGGSATNDGGAGMMQALGAKLCDANGKEIAFGGGSLMALNSIDVSGLDPRLKDCTIRVACDVTNTLVGEHGASRIFGPQKGADEAKIVELDKNLSHFADVIKQSLALNLEEHIHDCTLVLTGEGRLDSQSIHGKVPVGVANVAKKYHKPVIGIAGSLTPDVGVVHQYGIDAVFSVLNSIGSLEEAFRGAYDNIYRSSRNIAATLQVGMRTQG